MDLMSIFYIEISILFRGTYVEIKIIICGLNIEKTIFFELWGVEIIIFPE